MKISNTFPAWAILDAVAHRDVVITVEDGDKFSPIRMAVTAHFAMSKAEFDQMFEEEK